MDVIYVVPMQTVDRKNKYKFRFSWLLLYYVVEFILNKIWDKGAFAFELDK